MGLLDLLGIGKPKEPQPYEDYHFYDDRMGGVVPISDPRVGGTLSTMSPLYSEVANINGINQQKTYWINCAGGSANSYGGGAGGAAGSAGGAGGTYCGGGGGRNTYSVVSGGGNGTTWSGVIPPGQTVTISIGGGTTVVSTAYPQPQVTLIESDRLTLFRHENMTFATDIDAINKTLGWLRDPEVTRYSEQGKLNHDYLTQRAYLIKEVYSGRDEYWFIMLNDGERGIYNKLIGTITVNVDITSAKHPTAVNIGIMLGDKTAWGQGYALEAMTKIISHHVALGVKHFEIGTMIENERMISLASACSMTEHARDDKYVYMSASIA